MRTKFWLFDRKLTFGGIVTSEGRQSWCVSRKDINVSLSWAGGLDFRKGFCGYEIALWEFERLVAVTELGEALRHALAGARRRTEVAIAAPGRQ